MVLEKICEMVAEQFLVEKDSVTAETAFVGDLGADSLDLYQILMGIEEEYGIKVPQEKAESISTVGEALELIRKATGDLD